MQTDRTSENGNPIVSKTRAATGEGGRRDFLKASVLAAAAGGAAILPGTAIAADAKSSSKNTAQTKTFLVVGGHVDDAEGASVGS